MSDKDKTRIVELQRQVKVARDALEYIKNGTADPEGVASEALTEMMPLDPKRPLPTTGGHSRR